MFEGFADEGTAFSFLVQAADADGAPVDADAVPTFRAYGQNGLLNGGTGSAALAETGVINNATEATPIVVTTTAAHGVTTGQPVTVSGVGGNTAANGSHTATYVSPTTFSLDGTTGNAPYTSGGAWHSTGLYRVTLTGGVLASLESGKTYKVIVVYEVSGDERVEEHTFTVR
jgi:hypothetical protein